MREALLERVRKLLALATSPNPHEAAAAAARAQALIAQHRLEGWLTDEPDTLDPIEDARDEPLEVSRRLRRWKAFLASALADVNGCVAYTLDRGTDEAIVLVGRRRDRAAVEALYHGLVKQIEWLSATHGAGQPKKWHESFRIGAVEAIARRLREVEPAEAAALGSTALTVLGPAMEAHRRALDRFVSERLRLGRGRNLTVIASAWREGRARSSEIDLPST